MKATRRRWLVRLALVLVGVAALLELGVRAVLLGGWFADRPELSYLRVPYAYAGRHEDVHWQLRLHRDRHGRQKLDPPRFDPQLGWLSGEVEPLTYEHRARGNLRGRRPVLLYGDSYAACAGSEGRCFEDLLEESELADRFALFNYGCGGYGVDQMYLLLAGSIDAWADDDPIVLVGVLLDDDLDRVRLELRGWTKPRLVVRDGALVPERDAVPTTRAYMQREFPPLRLWSWDLFSRSRLVPDGLSDRLRGETRADRACRALSERILNETVDVLERRGLATAFLLFNSNGSVTTPGWLGWREPAVTKLLQGRGVPYVLARDCLLQRVEQGEEPIEDYYRQVPPAANHLTELGNEVVFRDVLVPLLEQLDSKRR